MEEIIKVKEWDAPSVHYPRIQLGTAQLDNYILDRNAYYHANGQRPLGDTKRYQYFQPTKKLKCTSLSIDGKVWMVDDPPHWWTIQEYAMQYSGHVLVAGLGLGLIVHALAANPAVTDITVVELSKDVIDLVGPQVPKCNIINADWNIYRPDFKPDGVFYDLFVGDGRELMYDAIMQMVKLRETYPGIIHRILGFNNDYLIRMADAIIQSRKERDRLFSASDRIEQQGTFFHD